MKAITYDIRQHPNTGEYSLVVLDIGNGLLRIADIGEKGIMITTHNKKEKQRVQTWFSPEAVGKIEAWLAQRKMLLAFDKTQKLFDKKKVKGGI